MNTCDEKIRKIHLLAGVFEHPRTIAESSPRNTSERGIEGSNPSSSALKILFCSTNAETKRRIETSLGLLYTTWYTSATKAL
jgi:hypothetical protein